jgi:hypothetical protein
MTRERSALAFGLLLLPLALPVAMMHSDTFNGEFDYWAGSVMLVVFALAEAVLFAWVFGMDRGWAEIHKGAEVRILGAFRFIIQYITPVFLLLILIAFMFKPVGAVRVTDPGTGQTKTVELNWQPYLKGVFTGGPFPAWEWAGDGMVGKLMHNDVPGARAGALKRLDARLAELQYTPAEREAKLAALADALKEVEADPGLTSDQRAARRNSLKADADRLAADAQLGPEARQQAVTTQEQTRRDAEAFYDALPMWRNIDRLVMLGAFLFLCALVYVAWARRRAEGRPT